jgi:hypothetical protein
MERLEMLKEMFEGCGKGVFIMKMDDNDTFRIMRSRFDGNVSWVKCKKVLNDKGITFTEGHDGYGIRNGRCIEFNFKGV